MNKLYCILLSLINSNFLFACAVCYGAPDDPITLALNKSILFLLITITFILSCIIYGIISMAKKIKKINTKGV